MSNSFREVTRRYLELDQPATPNGGYAVQMPPGTPLPGAGATVMAQTMHRIGPNGDDGDMKALIKHRAALDAKTIKQLQELLTCCEESRDTWRLLANQQAMNITDLEAQIVTLKAISAELSKTIDDLTSPPASITSSRDSLMSNQIADCMASFGNGKLVP